ncbi:MAG TPA: ethanolamine utilization protein EutH [Candidatus Intestinimonas pullistercoris]|uniref:Ethanolamine utilization protein EutH n=1 Tax=Candidatus Intestinimonas pullistercoris TaxID=2838623 RepID=A0A9D2NXC7_9FIRM|nr:ethanolamine utilization protein EutH [uncultured Intestinimonas sp.]HJC40180.1 ethanolamine utilization protein EutH [Candidatus Intestinimonas pullistercoris]
MDYSELIAAADASIFTDSISSWIGGISINSVVMLIMMIFMLLGAIDKICGNKLGYGEKFEDGFNAMGGLAMSMAGVVAAAPVLRMLLGPILTPIYGIFGASPAMFATTLLACDMGGYPLAIQLAGDDVAIGNFAGLILGTMMGPTIVFTIPVALGIIKKEDRGYLGAGVLAGMITIPIGCIVGGLMMNTLAPEYHLGIVTILQNLIPVIIIAALIVIGLWVAPGPMIKGFNVFGTGVTIVITALTAIAVFQQITGIMLPVFYIMVENPADGSRGLDSGLLTCGQIAIVLIGAFPMVEWITRTFGKALEKIGAALGMNEAGSAGMVANLANNIAMFNIMGEMNPKGKLLNVAFSVSAAFVFGDHLGFTAGNNPDMIFPVIVGKLVAGVTAIIVANLLSGKLLSKIEATNA